ncbi:MAG: cysteine desulfurase [Methanothrix sp.]|nr:cysteine desulfurase [Methanothrix sp.]MDD1741376.1 cysteine desulfurase [Methanothrix sp.]OYV13524.1 MAG: cysteine desulfurase [Methanosaeta sp. ASO1]
MCGIYLDHQSCCPVDPRVEEFARRHSCIDFGNPSALHSRGLAAKAAVEEARGKVAELIGAENPECIIFTAGATQANNLAIRGAALRNAAKGKKLLASQIEHISVLNPHKDLKKGGFELDTIPVDGMGVIDVSSLERLAGKETVLASVMYANGEIGTVQPIKEVSEIVHREGTLLHVDATAAAGKIAVDVQKDGIDLLTLSSNDIYGPQGAGALYVRPGVRIQPVIFGGGQERGFSPGTENLYALAGFGEAARLARLEMAEESRRLLAIRTALIDEILKIDEAYLTGHPSQRLPHHASFRFSRIEGESILLTMDAMFNIQVSTGSACSSRTLEPSHVLLAIGLKHEEAHGSMIMTLGRQNSISQVPAIASAAKKTVERLRALSPL